MSCKKNKANIFLLRLRLKDVLCYYYGNTLKVHSLLYHKIYRDLILTEMNSKTVEYVMKIHFIFKLQDEYY